MASHYHIKPSEILKISDEWLAFCFDEVCYFYETKIYDEEELKYNWDLINFSGNQKVNSNQKFIDFIKGTKLF